MSGVPVSLLAIILAALAAMATTPPKKPSQQVLYLQLAPHKWCAYSAKQQWSAAVAKDSSDEVAVARYSHGRVVEIQYTVAADSGDWIVFDDYSIGGDGSPTRLSREIRFAQGERDYREEYSIARGASSLIRLLQIDPATGKPAPVAKRPWLPQIPVVTGSAGFPFSALLRTKSPGDRSVTCIPAP
jgi:hypothetical protein